MGVEWGAIFSSLDSCNVTSESEFKSTLHQREGLFIVNTAGF